MTSAEPTRTIATGRRLWIAWALVCGLLALLVGWAGWAQSPGNVVAEGVVVAETNARKLQHKEGGIVEKVLVKNGDHVKAGDLLIRLDDTLTRADLATLTRQLDELLAKQARLLAERNRNTDIAFPKQLLDRADDPYIADIIANQRLRMQERSAGLAAKIEQIKGQAARFESSSAGGRDIRIVQLQQEFRAGILQQLHRVRSEISRLDKQKLAASGRLSRMDIRSPRAGYVHRLTLPAEGGIVRPAEPVLHIVPKERQLLIEVKVLAEDIGNFFPGQTATVRLPAASERPVPELWAYVLTVSAEPSHDNATGAAIHTARLQLAKGEEEKLGKRSLSPGVSVEATVRTKDHTLLSALVEPVGDRIARVLDKE